MSTEHGLAEAKEAMLEDNEYNPREANGCPIRDDYDEEHFDDTMDNEENI